MLKTEGRRVDFVAPDEDQMQRMEELRRNLLLFFKEALANVARHADASHVRLEIMAHDGHLRLLIRYNGRGFDPRRPTMAKA